MTLTYRAISALAKLLFLFDNTDKMFFHIPSIHRHHVPYHSRPAHERDRHAECIHRYPRCLLVWLQSTRAKHWHLHETECARPLDTGVFANFKLKSNFATSEVWRAAVLHYRAIRLFKLGKVYIALHIYNNRNMPNMLYAYSLYPRPEKNEIIVASRSFKF